MLANKTLALLNQEIFNMLDIILWIAVGAFIGWNLPQPFWATFIQQKVISLYPFKAKE